MVGRGLGTWKCSTVIGCDTSSRIPSHWVPKHVDHSEPQPLPVLEAPQASAASQQPQPQQRKQKEADEDEAKRLGMAGQLGPKDFDTS